MNPINYSGKMIDSDNTNSGNKQLVPYNPSQSQSQSQYKNVDLFSIKNAYQTMIIQKH